AAQLLLVALEFGGVGELAVDQQVGHFFELAVLREVEDVVTAVVQVVAAAADGAQGGVAGGDAGQGDGLLRLEAGCGGIAAHRGCPSRWNPGLAGRYLSPPSRLKRSSSFCSYSW